VNKIRERKRAESNGLCPGICTGWWARIWWAEMVVYTKWWAGMVG